MEAEYVALSTSCKDPFSIIDIITKLCHTLNISLHNEADLHMKVHEDNSGALTLGLFEPRQMTPQSKHYVVKYHWFCDHIGPRRVKLVKIASSDQLGDIITKGLGKIVFHHL
jgi:hypothetical protein